MTDEPLKFPKCHTDLMAQIDGELRRQAAENAKNMRKLLPRMVKFGPEHARLAMDIIAQEERDAGK